MKFLPEPYIDISLKTSHICCLFCIELCQIVCDPCEIHFMLLISRSHTLHIYLCWLLHWKLRKNMPPIHTRILHRFDMTLHVAKIIWAVQKKSRRKLSMPRSLGKRKKKKKDSPYFKIKDRVMQKEVRVPSKKIPHTCTSWSDCMICFLYWIWFLTLQYIQDMYASFHSLPWAPQKALLEIGRRETI